MLGCVQQQAAQQPAVPGGKIAGLYAGGTLAAECAMLLAEKLSLPVDSEHPRGAMLVADGHRIIDMGDDFYTQGRPHPMIDPTARNQEIARLAQQPQTGVLLLDGDRLRCSGRSGGVAGGRGGQRARAARRTTRWRRSPPSPALNRIRSSARGKSPPCRKPALR